MSKISFSSIKKMSQVGIIGIGLLLLLELGLRQSDRLKTWPEKNLGIYHSMYSPDSTTHLYTLEKNDTLRYSPEEFHFNYWINEDGFVDRRRLADTAKEKPIIYLGDSFTFGVGAAKEKNVPFLLEASLGIPIYNAGVPGSDPFYEKKLIDKVFIPFGYNKYIFMCNLSDIYDCVFRGGQERFLSDDKVVYRSAPKIEYYYQKSFIVRAFVHKILKMDFSLLPPAKMKAMKDQAVNELAALFGSISKEIEFIVIIQPYPSQFSKSNKLLNEVLNEAYIQKLDSTLRSQQIKTINLYPQISQLINEENYLEYSWELDGHYNEKGYELLSQVIAEQLVTQYPDFIQKEEVFSHEEP